MNLALLLKHEVGMLNKTNIGGTEAIFLEDIQLLRQRGYGVEAYARFTDTRHHIKKLSSLTWCIPLVTRWPRWRTVLRTLSEFYYTYMFARKTRGAVRIGYSTPLLPLFARNPIVLFQNEHHEFIYPRILSRIYSHGTYLFCSQYLKNVYCKQYSFLNKTNAFVLYNAVDTRVFTSLGKRGSSHKPIKLLYCGAWAREKGLDMLLQALIELQKKNGASLFSFTVSSNPQMWYSDYPLDRQRYIQYVYLLLKQLKHVTLVGGVKRKAMPHLYHCHDYTVVPSIWNEPFGLVALESIACGTPVIAFQSGGLPEILSKQNAIVLPPDIDSLIKTLTTIIQRSKTFKKPILLTSKNKRMLQSYRITRFVRLFDRQ